MKGTDFRRGYTREEVGRMTMMDIRMMGSERNPYVARGLPIERPRTAEEIERYQASLIDKRNSWEL